jgi:hypothetical protein
MYYAGQSGRRLPVPIFQAMEDFAIFGILLLVERWLRSIAPATIGAADGAAAPGSTRLLPPAGIVLGVGMVLWGIERFLDEHLWLGEDGHLGSLLVQIAGIALAVVGAALLVSRIGPLQRWRRGEGGDPGPVAASAAVARPMPDPPPVTTATLPESAPIVSPCLVWPSRHAGPALVVPVSHVVAGDGAESGSRCHPTGDLRHTGRASTSIGPGAPRP